MSSKPKHVVDPNSKHYVSNAASKHQGSPKKHGGGGKFTWGEPGLGDLALPLKLDEKDPAYDSEEEEAADLAAYAAHAPAAADAGALPDDAYKEMCRATVLEYFESEAVDDVLAALHAAHRGEWIYEFCKQAIVCAMERDNRARELVSRLLSALYGTALNAAHLEAAFRLLLLRVDDLKLDTPSAPELLGTFIARAVVDDLLPPVFVSATTVTSSEAMEALDKAHSLLQDGVGSAARLEAVWMPPSTTECGVKALKTALRVIVEEYACNDDLNEADRSLRELAVPSFHFQLVKAAVCHAVSTPTCVPQICALLGGLNREQLLSDAHLRAGFQCCIDHVADIAKDFSPKARDVLLQLLNLGVQQGFVERAFLDRAAMQTKKNLAKDARKMMLMREELLKEKKEAEGKK